MKKTGGKEEEDKSSREMAANAHLATKKGERGDDEKLALVCLYDEEGASWIPASKKRSNFLINVRTAVKSNKFRKSLRENFALFVKMGRTTHLML